MKMKKNLSLDLCIYYYQNKNTFPLLLVHDDAQDMVHHDRPYGGLWWLHVPCAAEPESHSVVQIHKRFPGAEKAEGSGGSEKRVSVDRDDKQNVTTEASRQHTGSKTRQLPQNPYLERCEQDGESNIQEHSSPPPARSARLTRDTAGESPRAPTSPSPRLRPCPTLPPPPPPSAAPSSPLTPHPSPRRHPLRSRRP